MDMADWIGIPFRRMLYTAVLFGGFALAERCFPVLRERELALTV
jgi:hypothetical protein